MSKLEVSLQLLCVPSWAHVAFSKKGGGNGMQAGGGGVGGVGGAWGEGKGAHLHHA